MAYEKENMKVEIVSTKFIKPSSPTPNHLQNYKLSFFDQIADEAHLPLVLFYPPTNNINYASHEQQVEQSLSRILSHVYPMAGRFNEDIDSIYCQDQGVKFVKAKVNGKLINEFLEKAHKDVNLALLCWPQDTWDVDDTNLSIMPIVIVEITELECGGLALSVSHAHTAMDGFTIFNTIYEWDLSKLLLPSAPEEDRVEANLVEKRLYINEDSISRLREEVGDLCFKPSRVEMIIALLWRALIRASEKKHGHLRRSLIGVPINLRPRLSSLPQVEKPFGNLVIEALAKFVPGENNMELREFVKMIRDAVLKNGKGVLKKLTCLQVQVCVDFQYKKLILVGENHV
ncbi:putative trans-2-enoyl-CoA reductase, mitochondrial-like isoform 1 [Capsicum annuum]|nr:putative trans-2-enoyl-CoA reductase, mitochondrial-like isoform 1 [Capsicum annuum]KAF3684064.1 putative trans-2-enoyl-CoA reductase, mitochondrial-like isoform 1 [Capsicum annuum]